MNYELYYGPGIERDMSRLPVDLRKRIDRAIMKLPETPRPSGCKKLVGHGALYRVGDWRIVYEIDDRRQRVDVQLIAHRRKVHRGL